MKRAAIVTLNQNIKDFILPELQLFGYEVIVASAVTDSFGDFEFVVVDVDTVTSGITGISAPIVAVSGNYTTEISADGCMLAWPCALNDIFDICNAFNVAKPDGETMAGIKNDVVTLIDGNTVAVNNHYIKLSGHELTLLKALCSANGEVVSREKIMELLDAEDGNISDVYVCHLRRKLDSKLGRKLIITERGKGYRTSLKFS